MTKPNSIINPPPTEMIFNPYTHYVKPVSKVEVDESGTIHVIYSESKPVLFTCNLICCNEDVVGKVRDEILREELQLNYEAGVVTRMFLDQGRDDEVAALLIDKAIRSEALALKYASLYQGDANKKLAINLIYDQHASMAYGRALTCIKRIMHDDKFPNKQLLGKLLIFAHGKYLASCVIRGNDALIKRAKEEGKEIDRLLVTMGLGGLVDKHAMVEGIEIKQDTFLPLFAPFTTLGGMIYKMFSSDESKQSIEGSDSSVETKSTDKNKRF